MTKWFELFVKKVSFLSDIHVSCLQKSFFLQNDAFLAPCLHFREVAQKPCPKDYKTAKNKRATIFEPEREGCLHRNNTLNTTIVSANNDENKKSIEVSLIPAKDRGRCWILMEKSKAGAGRQSKDFRVILLQNKKQKDIPEEVDEQQQKTMSVRPASICR